MREGRPEGGGQGAGAGRAACACACRPHRRGALQQATCTEGVDARQGWWRGQGGGGGATPGEHAGEGGASDGRVGSMCLRVPAARPRSTRRGRGAPQQATCTNGLGASRAVAGQAVGLHQNTTSGRGGGLVGRCSHRSTDEKRCRRGRWRRTRGCRCRREPPPEGGGRARARGAARAAAQRLCAPAGRPARGEPGCRPFYPIVVPTRAPAARAALRSPPPPPPASARARAGRPSELGGARELPGGVASTAQVSQSCGLRGARPSPDPHRVGAVQGS